jgi:probable HAF family extracellular repeat protein
MTDLGTLGGWNSEALAINNKSQMVGDAETSFGTTQAFFYQTGSYPYSQPQEMGDPANTSAAFYYAAAKAAASQAVWGAYWDQADIWR